jgi:hypothetical protein
MINAIAVLSIAGKIIETVRDLEAVDSTTGKGPAKKALALIIIEAAYNATVPKIPFEAIKAAVGTIIDAAVAFYGFAKNAVSH